MDGVVVGAKLVVADSSTQFEGDAQYRIIALKDARIHRSAIVTDTSHVAFDFKCTIESRVVIQPSGGGRITIGAEAVIMPDCMLRCGPDGLSIGRRAFLDEGVICDGARSIGDGAIIERCCILGKDSEVRERALLLQGAVLPPGAVAPPYSIMAGDPAVVIADAALAIEAAEAAKVHMH